MISVHLLEVNEFITDEELVAQALDNGVLEIDLQGVVHLGLKVQIGVLPKSGLDKHRHSGTPVEVLHAKVQVPQSEFQGSRNEILRATNLEDVAIACGGDEYHEHFMTERGF